MNSLADYTDTEILAEFQLRQADAKRRAGRFSSATMRSPAKSAAKKIYWSAWRRFKSTHPGATLAEYQLSTKKGGTK